ncbi:MAG: CheR family methyltransferase [Gemmatimonadota bacterium]
MPTPFTDDEYRLFSDWLAREYGLRFGPEKREILRARLDPLRAALDLPTFERLLFRVRFHPGREEDRRTLIAHLTNNESYFFRESSQLEILRELLQELHRGAKAEGRPLRILSAGAASGEEPYTLAAISREVLGASASVDVTGVDVDEVALERAREAVYRTHALRGVGDDLRDRYFRPTEEGRWRLRERVRSAARFQHGNIVDPAWPDSLPAQDVVFCRNVLIYFDKPALQRAAENLYRVVRPGGYLFLGHAESLTRMPTRFVPERRPGAVFYRRPKE